MTEPLHICADCVYTLPRSCLFSREVLELAKRRKGKRHKNRRSDGTLVGSRGSSSRNRNWGFCSHLDYSTGKKCGERVHVKRGERAFCDEHRHRHTSIGKTMAIIKQCESVEEESA